MDGDFARRRGAGAAEGAHRPAVGPEGRRSVSAGLRVSGAL